jgi:CRISPR system Cascade subunit CasA
MMPMHDLLVEPTFCVTMPDASRQKLTLPGVLAELARDDIVSFDHLRQHQEHAWYSFLVQLAAIALVEENILLDAADEGTWRERLLSLTANHGGHAPWCLVVEDLSLPAFMQPPVPEDNLDAFKECVDEPDAGALDLLVTSKSHDVKAPRVSRPSPDHWVFALVALQTMQGYSGKKNYGIVRMNGGYGSRPCITLAPGRSWGARFRRDVGILLRSRSMIVDQLGYRERGGLALLWLIGWDGQTSLFLQGLDPYFIEVCRRVRLLCEEHSFAARTAATSSARINAETLLGNTGDPWTPVGVDGKALSVSGKKGFAYQTTARLLFGRDFLASQTQRVEASDPPELEFLAWVLARGQGKTEGLHERWVPVPTSVRRRLTSEDARTGLGELAQQRIRAVEISQRGLLRPALCALLQGGAAKLKLDDDRAWPWVQRHDRAVDSRFFPSLWRDLELEPGEAQVAWQRELIDMGREVLREAEGSVPLSAARRYRGLATAEGMFEGLARKHFPDVFYVKEDKNEPSA